MAHTVKRVAVVATGTIGASWAAYFLARGLDVEAIDPSPGAEQRLRDAVAAHWVALAQQGLASGQARSACTFMCGWKMHWRRPTLCRRAGPSGSTSRWTCSAAWMQ